MPRVQLIDVWNGAGALGTYNFHINHSEEDEFGVKVSYQRTATTAGVGFVRQMGEPQPAIFRLKGTILQRVQYQEMWSYWYEANGAAVGPARTLHFVDQLSARFEVLFTAFNPIRHRAGLNPRGATPNEKLVYWTYEMELEVIRDISGWP